MSFEQFYESELEPYIIELNYLMLSGRTLKEEDCAQFWKLFKSAQQHAYDCGVKSVQNN